MARLAESLTKKVIMLENDLVHSLGVVCETRLLPSDYYWEEVSRRYAMFVEKYLSVLTCGEFDVITTIFLLWKNLPTTLKFIGDILDPHLDLKTDFPVKLRLLVQTAWVFHSKLPANQQQNPGGILRFVHGPEYVFFNFTVEVICHMANYTHPVNFGVLCTLPENASPSAVCNHAIPLYNRMHQWALALKECNFTQMDRMTKNRVKCGPYSSGWQIRRLIVFLRIFVDPRLCTFFAAGLSLHNTNPKGNVRFGGLGFLSLDPQRLKKGSRRVFLLRVLLRALSKTSLSSFIEKYDLDHLHIGELSMLVCLFADVIINNLPDMQVRVHVADISNVKASNSVRSDNPPWFVTY